ncbi:hypothetical protein L3081_25555 [Colwellia sp. MSW7]|uniref:Uncharacterized protein n=1 Tax=Colwellia maritima TaxID=2912588 RepID=A0ABS9X7H6_9GAMM|nr:hypothetical protein [Colwellia maritima]MCI2286183.1 hypothetical protein [Colwellia maritima]
MEADPLDLSDEKFQFEKIVEIFKGVSIDFNNVNPVLKQEVERAAKLGWGCPIFNAKDDLVKCYIPLKVIKTAPIEYVTKMEFFDLKAA